MKARGSRAKKRRKSSPPQSSIIKSIIRLERRVWRVAQQRNAREFKKLVPPDAVMIFQSGVVLQPEYLASMQERTIERYELHNIRAFMPNATTVILFYHALRLGHEGRKIFPSSPVIESTTWIKRGKRWVAILNQETPVSHHETPASY